MSLGDVRKSLYYRIFGADGAIRSVLQPTDRVLDVGCSVGTGSVLLARRPTFGVDIHLESLRRARSGGQRSPVTCADIVALPFADRSFEVVVALDVLEHLEADVGLLLLAELRRVSARDVVLLTPSGFDPQPAEPDQPWMEHRSGWSAPQLEAEGFRVRGWGGARQFRIPGSGGRFRLGPLGGVAAAATRWWFRARPARSFHLLGTQRR